MTSDAREKEKRPLMTSLRLVPFLLDDHRYALHLGVVERVIPAVEITPLPKAPEIVLGLINIRGKIIPTLNIRRRLQLPERETELTDHFIIANTPKRTVALPAVGWQGHSNFRRGNNRSNGHPSGAGIRRRGGKAQGGPAFDP